MYKLLLVASVLISISCLDVLASDPPKDTGKAAPPVWTKPGAEWFDNHPATPDPHAKAEASIAAGLGSSMMHGRYKHGVGPTATSLAIGSVPLAGSTRFNFAITPNDVSTGSPRAIYTYSYVLINTDETEPSIVSDNINDGTGVQTYHVSAFHRPGTQNGSYDAWLHASTSTALSSASFTTTTPTMLYVPVGYSFSTDPWVTASSFDDGIAPRRVYISGVTANRDANGDGVSPSAVRVWYSDNGGKAWWSNGWPVDSRVAGQGLLDRPTSAVSEYSGTRGYFYVAYTEFAATMRLWITSSTNGVTPYCTAVAPVHCLPPQLSTALVSANDGPFAPQIVINPTTGRLYVLWWTQLTPYGDATIRMRRSSDWSVNNFEVDGGGNPVEYTIAHGYASPDTLSNGIRAVTTVSAKYNSATHRIDVAWHGSDATSNGTAIYFVSFDPDTVSAFNTPMNFARVDAPGDQYDPILDHDSNGWAFVSYLSNQDSRNANNQFDNYRFKHYGFSVAPWGTIYTATPLESSTHYPRWPGDYHGNFFWTSLDADGARWNTIDATPYPDPGPADLRWTGVK